MQVVEIARNDAEMSLESVIAALQEVEDRKLNALAMTKRSVVITWFSINAGALARFIKENMVKQSN